MQTWKTMRRLPAETQKTVVHLCLNCNTNTVDSSEVEGDLAQNFLPDADVESKQIEIAPQS